MNHSKPTAVKMVWILLGAVSVFFHLFLVFSGMIPHMVSRPIHMALAAPWALIFVAKGPISRWSGIFLTTAVILSCGYIVINESALSDQYGALYSTFN